MRRRPRPQCIVWPNAIAFQKCDERRVHDVTDRGVSLGGYLTQAGTHFVRTVEIDTAGGPGFDTEQFRARLPALGGGGAYL
jgi:hypothetical protein